MPKIIFSVKDLQKKCKTFRVTFMKAITLILTLFASLFVHAETVKPMHTTQFILERILEYKNLTFQSEIPMPEVVLSSKALLKDFQDDIEPQWGIRPDVITNAYVVRLNKIYLYDDKAYYAEHGRCIDDSLAHELAHYVQVQYRKWDLNDDSLEWDAIDTQTWFRSQHCSN